MPVKIIDDDRMIELLESGRNQKQVATILNVSPVSICKRIKKLGYTPRPKKTPEPPKPLPENKQRFVDAVIEGKTLTQAALETQNVTTRGSAKVRGHKLSKEPDVKQAIKDRMKERGITLEAKADVILDCMDAKDGNIRLKAVELANKMDGTYSDGNTLSGMDYFMRTVINAHELGKEAGRKEQSKIINITPERTN